MKFWRHVTLPNAGCLEKRMNKKLIVGGGLAVLGILSLSAPKAEAGVNISIGFGLPGPVVYVPVAAPAGGGVPPGLPCSRACNLPAGLRPAAQSWPRASLTPTGGIAEKQKTRFHAEPGFWSN
jgi:hypothetical protein